MKRSVELDTWEIANRLTAVDNDLHLAQLACDGIEGDEEGGSIVANLIFKIREDLSNIADIIHPGPPVVEEVAHIRRVADAKIEQLVKDADGASA